VASDELLKSLRQHNRLFVALDNTTEANTKSREMTVRLVGEAYLPQLPHAVKDANDWLAKYGANAEDASAMLNRAQSWLTVEVQMATKLDGLAHQDAIHRLFIHAHSLEGYALAEFKAQMERLDIKGRAFTDLLKVAHAQTPENKEPDNEMP